MKTKDILIILTGILSLIYLINPSVGLFEILPDTYPLIGNSDEATACALLLVIFRYFGIDLTNFLRTFSKIKQPGGKK